MLAVGSAYRRGMDEIEEEKEELFAAGSRALFADFHVWCRVSVELAVAEGSLPKLLFANGPDFDFPMIEWWDETFVPPTTSEFLVKLIPVFVEQTGASQVAVSVAFGGEDPGVLLIVVDETDHAVEEAGVVLEDGELVLGQWYPVAHQLPIAAWQRLLSRNAGYDDFAKWRCRECRSVCPGESALTPAPCDFCGSFDVERVALETALAPARLPYPDDETLDFLEALRPFFSPPT